MKVKEIDLPEADEVNQEFDSSDRMVHVEMSGL